MKLIIKIIVISILFLNLSCSSKKTEHKVTTTETVENEPTDETKASKKTVVKEEVKEETEDSGGDFGILGTTVSLIGEIIALPFRLVAGIIDFIF